MSRLFGRMAAATAVFAALHAGAAGAAQARAAAGNAGDRERDKLVHPAGAKSCLTLLYAR